MSRLFLQLTLLITILLSTALTAKAMAQPAPTPPPRLAGAVAARQLTVSESPFPGISVDLPTTIPRAPGGNTTLTVTPSSTSDPNGAAVALGKGSFGAAVYGALVAVVLVVVR
ncbi:uncharacterized protein PpBr36_09554 [Pyricularia pennisetigena]|uniref:uncharacterized protein n=1 Tax=Pyricularia pennisetigena TaxID=1578925 RepID=UPI001150757A|nr:uncharacterized protein PpBr36_09554 [Pyricularia pennisetigena]TLS21618.1 hypothetical protein PpBr36_09554 [Pyricularia pennisetigena]